MDRTRMKPSGARWYRRLQVQLWLWATLPFILVIAALTFTGVYSHERAMRHFVSERDVALATLYAEQIDDALAHGTVTLDGLGLVLITRTGTVGQRGVIYVVDEDGHVLFYPGFEHVGEDWSGHPAVRQAPAAGSGAVRGNLLDGTPTLASIATVGETGWRVFVEEPISDVIVPILRFSSVLPVLIAAAGLLSLLLAYFSLRTVVEPLQRLADAATRITWGELEGLPSDAGGVEEIRHLGRALRDMVERIRGYQQSMRDYIAAMMQGQEAERARLSRELHDETVQNWIAAGQRLRLVQRSLEHGDTRSALETVEETRQLTSSALDELRRLVRALRPTYLEHLGLLPALDMLIQDIQGQGWAAEMVVQGETRRLRPEVELTAYRVAQEALTNAAQHSQAQEVMMTVSFGLGQLLLSVVDNGVGFFPAANPEAMTEKGHFGLVGMRERVLLVGGSLDIQSQPGQGTRVLARFPTQTE
jgi:signal transduction histidine kinase